MTREQKLYCKIGQAVCDTAGALLLVGIPIAACNLAGFLETVLF